jgi:hypothetical protein
LRQLTSEGEPVSSELRLDLQEAEDALDTAQKARRARQRKAWRDFVEGLGEILGFVDDLVDEDSTSQLALTAQKVLQDARIPVDTLDRAVDIAKVVVDLAQSPILEEGEE